MKPLNYLSGLAFLLFLTSASYAGSLSGTANVEFDAGRMEISVGSDKTPAASSGMPAHSGSASIPPGHLPPPGKCRIWHHDREPGQQPPPGDCKRLRRSVPPGASLIRG